VSDDPQQAASVEGTVAHIVWTNPDSGFTILRLELDDRPLPVAVKGVMPGVTVGERIHVHGRWIEDPRYGRQIDAEGFLPVDPRTADGLERHLASSLFDGIGPVFAKRLRAHFGDELLTILDEHPERVREVDGIGPTRAARIVRAWQDKRAQRDALLFLQGLGLKPGQSTRILKRYAEHTVARVRENPWRMADDVGGVGFLTADRVGAQLGIPKDSPARLKAGLQHLLNEAQQRGHCFVPRTELLPRGEALLGLRGEPMVTALADLLVSGRAVAEGSRIWPAELHAAEEAVKDRIQTLRDTAAPSLDLDIPSALNWAEERSGLKLTAAQREALAQALVNKIVIITGGPGTGKTTLVRALLDVWQRKNLLTALAAPTGRAARRLEETTGRKASTLHKLLEYSPAQGRFLRDLGAPLTADAAVVDEASMLDLPLAQALLDGLPDATRLVLVGDVEQLPSVGPGRVLADLIDSGVLPVVRLDVVFRQDAAGLIVNNAHRILRGLPPRSADGPEGDFFVVQRESPAAALRTVVHLVSERIPKGFGLDPTRDVQVLSPMRKGECGTESLNEALGQALNPREGRGLRPGDRVMQLRNDYDKDVFNGDTGVVAQALPAGALVIRFDDGREVDYAGSDRNDLAPAWAITIHKSQGSEYPAVVIPLVRQHQRMLQRNLLYTAITRGRRLVVLVGDPEAIARAIGNDRADRRWTGLAARLSQG
jgi:exodeoxyribonuclease V alpha subunit